MRGTASILAILLVACGSNAGGEDDTSTDHGTDPAVDDGTDTTVDTTVDDMAGDTPADPAPDTASDLDDAGDGDTEQDSPGDPDAIEDAGDPDGACLPLEVRFQADSVDAWTQCWMGTGTSAVFTLVFTNPSSGCAITGVSVDSGSMRLSSDDSVVFTFGTLTSTTGFPGTVPAGASLTSGYMASDGTVDGSPLDGLDVYVRANVSSSSGSGSARSGDTPLTCVY